MRRWDQLSTNGLIAQNPETIDALDIQDAYGTTIQMES